MVEVYWLTDTLQQKLSILKKNWPLFCPLEGTWNQQNHWFAFILEKSARTVIISVFACMNGPNPILFPLFCLINHGIPWKYTHFAHFVRKSGQKMGENGKILIFLDYFHAKCWQLSENIPKSTKSSVVNHIWFKKLANSPI